MLRLVCYYKCFGNARALGTRTKREIPEKALANTPLTLSSMTCQATLTSLYMKLWIPVKVFKPHSFTLTLHALASVLGKKPMPTAQQHKGPPAVQPLDLETLLHPFMKLWTATHLGT